MTALKPRNPVPDLDVQTLGGDIWKLAEQAPEHFTMIVFYRGLHCPICKPYLRDLDRRVSDFASLGVGLIAISSDIQERAARSQQEWQLQNLTIGYGLPIAKAREWGLYVSRAIKEEEPAEFIEPGLFLIKPDKTLYSSVVNTMPFARPAFSEILTALDFIIKNDYPARGEA